MPSQGVLRERIEVRRRAVDALHLVGQRRSNAMKESAQMTEPLPIVLISGLLGLGAAVRRFRSSGDSAR